MLNKRSFNIGISIAFILLWGLVVLHHLICNSFSTGEVGISLLLLYIYYVISECNEIKHINEDDKYDD